MASGEVRLGINEHRGQRQEVWLPLEDRLRHTYVIGATGTGKSTLLLNLMVQDVEAGRGLGLLDPHGDLADDLPARIPKRRHKDVVVFDPADTEFPIAFNVLHAHSEREKELLASDFVAIFRRFSTTWGDQMTAVMSNARPRQVAAQPGAALLEQRLLFGPVLGDQWGQKLLPGGPGGGLQRCRSAQGRVDLRTD